ncbi:hypothetical protein BGW38_008224 [Lunasporangiospora selenospora]|uniref:Uncharacterized protein n=1 Tax=Lunasporangiospora selenospora TaxID=979761 RepID=A0A9P6KGL7_9FUNG|nr:hypothetical protein BGW38_008224 [Lunasporangiospora selenospora]
MQEIEMLAKTSRDLAQANQDLEDDRMIAVSDQARTAKRLLVMTSQLDYTEQRLYNLTKQYDDGQKDVELLRIERLRRESLQEREDAGRLKIETLQEELDDAQRSERMLQQKLVLLQGKHETLVKRHDNLKRQQQELELARESREALAWLKETTDRLCSPPQSGFGQNGQRERFANDSGPDHISPSPSPPYPSSFIDPPLAAQNQLISLIKELATTNSTLRSELNEFKDLLQDSRNEVLELRTQVEDYEQGPAYEQCCDTGSDTVHGPHHNWGHLGMSAGGGLDAASHIGTLGSIPGSPPAFMTAPPRSSRHNHHIHMSGVRGNVFGELERLYSRRRHRRSSSSAPKHKRRSSSSKRRRDISHPHSRTQSLAHSTSNLAIETSHATASSTAPLPIPEVKMSPIPTASQSQIHGSLINAHGNTGLGASSPGSNAGRSRRSIFTDITSDSSGEWDENDHDMHTSGVTDSESEHEVRLDAALESVEIGEPGDPLQISTPALDAPVSTVIQASPVVTESIPTIDPLTQPTDSAEHIAVDSKRTSGLSHQSMDTQELVANEGHEKDNNIKDQGPAEPEQPLSKFIPSFEMAVTQAQEDPILDELDLSMTYPSRNRLSLHEKSISDQGPISVRQRRRLSEPLHHFPSASASPSMTMATTPTKKKRPGSIYSLRRHRPVVGSPDSLFLHSSHVQGNSIGYLELQRCKSAELMEQIMAEHRQRRMEAWRAGVVAASVSQQQQSTTQGGGPRMDSDNISIRSKASRRRVALDQSTPGTKEVRESGELDFQDKPPLSGSTGIGPLETPAVGESRSSQQPIGGQDSETGAQRVATSNSAMLGLGISAVESKQEAEMVLESEQSLRDNDDSEKGRTPLSINTTRMDAINAQMDSDSLKAVAAASSHASIRAHKRFSQRSMRSIRSSYHMRSPIVRSPVLGRDRRFPSEMSTASEAFSARRYDLEGSPYQLLHTLSTDLLERLNRSDTREMNRRLKRTFDIQALSQMSNSVIENVLTDVNNLGERFRWVEAQVGDTMDEMMDRTGVDMGVGSAAGISASAEATVSGAAAALADAEASDSEDEQEPDDEWRFSVVEFFPLANAVQEMLSEIGKLRMTINELQLSYVQKVEQDRIKAEKDFMQGAGSEEKHFVSEDELGPLPKTDRILPSRTKSFGKNKPERPKLLESASTQVSGFFSKVFGVNTQGSQEEQQRNAAAQKATASQAQSSNDAPKISKSKSGPAIAETTKIQTQTSWIMPSNKPAEQMASATSSSRVIPVAERQRPSRSIAIPPSVVATVTASSSLAAIRTMSPARPSALPAVESTALAKATATASNSSQSRPRAIDIRLGASDNKRSTGMARSPGSGSASASSFTNSAKGLLSRSFPQSQHVVSLQAPAGLTAVSFESSDTAPTDPSMASASSSHVEEELQTAEEDRVRDMTVVTFPSRAGDTGLLAITTASSESSESASGVPSALAHGQLPFHPNKNLRTIEHSTRGTGSALNAVTIYQEQHWSSSTPSLPAPVATGASTTEAIVESATASAAASITSSISNGGGGDRRGIVDSPVEEHHLSTGMVFHPMGAENVGGATSTALSSLHSLVSKPTLIARSGLAVTTPSTSTVSSPVSTTSWFDARRASGGNAPAAAAAATAAMATAASANTALSAAEPATGIPASSSVVSKTFSESSGGSKTLVPERESIFNFFAGGVGGAGAGSSSSLALEAGSGSGSGQAEAAATISREGTPIETMTTRFQKLRTRSSFHSFASGSLSTGSLTRSLGRAASRDSAIAFLRGESQATSALGALLLHSQNVAASNSASASTLASAAASGSDSVFSSSPHQEFVAPSMLTTNGDQNHVAGLEQTILCKESGTVDAGASQTMNSVTGTGDKRDQRAEQTRAGGGWVGSSSTTLPTNLSQKETVASTAVAYVVALPDSQDDRDGQGPSRPKAKRAAVFNRELIMASQKRILANAGHSQEAQYYAQQYPGHNPPLDPSHPAPPKPFEPDQRPRRTRALSVDSSQSLNLAQEQAQAQAQTQAPRPLRGNEFADLLRVGAGVWRGLIRKVDGREN